MQPHDLTAGGDVLDRVTRCAQQATTRYGCHPAATVRLLNVSENATYLVDDPDQEPSILRVHRLGYHTGLEIESELAWMDALRAEAGVRTPRGLAAADGRRGGGRGAAPPRGSGPPPGGVAGEGSPTRRGAGGVGASLWSPSPAGSRSAA